MATTATNPVMAQRLDALDVGNRIRTSNARTLKEIRGVSYVEGLALVADILRHGDVDGPLGVVPAWRLVTSISSVGEERAETIFANVDITRVRRPLRRMTTRQRHRLADELGRLPMDARTR